ncbi:MAG: ferredoxin [Candidatus Omnitrophota bacterium]
MSKVSVDITTCVGCGLCEQSCPEVFVMEADGVAHVKAHSCSAHNLKEVSEQCPVNCIKVVE